MQSVVSVKKPLVIGGLRWSLYGKRLRALMLVEARHLRALAANPINCAALSHTGVRPARRNRLGAAALAHVTGEDLRLVNLRGRIECNANQVVDDITGDDASWPPVVGYADHVQR